MKKRILHLAVILIMAITTMPIINVNAARIIDGGKCGENATWTLDSEGTFIVSGEGKMNNFDSTKDLPWFKYQEDIKTLKIETGITSIGVRTFLFCANIKEAYIPDSVTTIEGLAFDQTKNLTDIYFDNTEKQWNKIQIKGYNFYLKNATKHFSEIETKFSVNPEFLDGYEWNVLHLGFQDIDKEYTLVLTVQKEGETIWTQTRKLNVNQNYIQIPISIRVLEEATVVKAFIWDDLESIRPLCPPKIIKPNKPN